jgi:hypothetical protein
MNKLRSFKNKSSRVGAIRLFSGLKPLELELSFEAGFDEAREWARAASDQGRIGASLPGIESQA